MEYKYVPGPSKGINKYLPAHLIDDKEWSDGMNVYFGAGYVKKCGGYEKFTRQPNEWAATNAYTLGAYCIPTTATGIVYKCTTAGTSGATEPTWPTSGTVSDGGAVWTFSGYNVLDGVVMRMDTYRKYNGDTYLMAITTKRCYYFDSTNLVFIDITGADLSGSPDYPVVSANAQDYFVFTNGVDNVKYWDGTMSAIENLPGLFAPSAWQTGHDYSIGDYCRPTSDNSFVYRCSDAGTSGGVEPTWSETTSTPTSDEGVVWDLVGTYGAEGGVTDIRCTTLRYVGNFLLLGNTVENGNQRPQRVRWSCIGQITGWKIVTDNIAWQEAGYGDFTDDVSAVQAICPLGNYVVVYKEESINRMYYVGGTTIWKTYPAIIGKGCIGPLAVVDLGDKHIFVGKENIYSFDLMTPKRIGDQWAEYFFLILDPGKTQLIAGFYQKEVPEIFFAFVSTNSEDYPDKAISYNTNTGAWAVREMPMTSFGNYIVLSTETWNNVAGTWDEATKIWDSSKSLANAPINLCSDENGVIYQFDGNSFDGAAIDGYLTSKLFDFDFPHFMKRIHRIQFMTSREGDYSLNVYVGTTGNVEDDIVWYGPYEMSLDQGGNPWVDLDITGRYMCFKVGTTNANEPFKITGYMIKWEKRGEI